MIICLGTTPAVQRVMRFARFEVNHVNRAVEIAEGGGGKFVNTAKALTCLGDAALALGIAGEDRGTFLAQTLRQNGVEFNLLPVSSRTRLCTTILDSAGGTVTELVEESPPVTHADCERLISALKEALPRCQALILSGTIAPGGPADLYFRCAEVARAAGLLTVIDAQGEALLRSLPCGPDVVKPNRAELEKTLGRHLRSEDEILSAMDELLSRGARAVVVTRGAEPCLARDRCGTWKVNSPRIQPVNPIGSGDSFTAGLTSALVKGAGLGEACRCGVAAGGANALSLMPGMFLREDYERLLAETFFMPGYSSRGTSSVTIESPTER